MRLPRLTTRRLMVLVAVAAMAWGASKSWKRREYCLRGATDMDGRRIGALIEAGAAAELSGLNHESAEMAREQGKADLAVQFHQEGDRLGRLATERRTSAHRFGRQATRLRHTARYPWLPVPQDPPMPE